MFCVFFFVLHLGQVELALTVKNRTATHQNEYTTQRSDSFLSLSFLFSFRGGLFCLYCKDLLSSPLQASPAL